MIVLAILAFLLIVIRTEEVVEVEENSLFYFDDPRLNLLGSGFDILENQERQSIFVLASPKQADPKKVILTDTLPQGVVMKSSPKSNFHLYAQVIDRNSNIMDSRDIKVSGSGGFWKISGSFSVENKVVKRFISRNNHKVTRVIAKIELDRYLLEVSEGLEVTKGFSDRINRINILLQKKTALSLAEATRLTDQVLNLFGTHFVTEIVTGGYITKIDAVDLTSWEQSTDQTFSASASVSFASFFKLNAQYKTEHSDVEKYSNSVTDTFVVTTGGESWKEAGIYNDWIEGLPKNPATVGIRVRYILDAINTEIFPLISQDQAYRILQLMEQRLEVYEKNNYYKGCSDPTASNYVEYTNVFDPKMCNYKHTFHFGGLYTTSSNPSYAVKNELTNDFTCPVGFKAFNLVENTIQIRRNGRSCHRCWLFCTCCHSYQYYDEYPANTMVCLSEKEEKNGFFFGGAYTNTINNDFTQGKSCPEKYVAFPIYHESTKRVVTNICMAPYDSGRIISVPFGGIFSSQNPNFLIGSKPVCGDGFERHPLGGNPIAEITYCVKMGSLDIGGVKDIIPPGYGQHSISLDDLLELGVLKNGTKVGLIVDMGSKESYVQQAVTYSDYLRNNLTMKEETQILATQNTNGIREIIELSYLEQFLMRKGLYNNKNKKKRKKNNERIIGLSDDNKKSNVLDEDFDIDHDEIGSSSSSSKTSFGLIMLTPTLSIFLVMLSCVGCLFIVLLCYYCLFMRRKKEKQDRYSGYVGVSSGEAEFQQIDNDDNGEENDNTE